jgi:hypothetical protein
MSRSALFSSASFRDSVEAKPPPGWKNPLRQEMHQVVVTRTKDGRQVRFGPAMQKDACQQLADAIKDQIVRGFERLVAEPTVIHVPSVRSY